MLAKSTLIAAVAAATLIASPAFAQSFTPSSGTGNATQSYFDDGGRIHLGTPSRQNQQIAIHRTGLNAFASVPRASTGVDDPAATGGGSSGYNEGLRTNEW
jgi:opacity protein-like surface antigen